jgi:hypothetical protein
MKSLRDSILEHLSMHQGGAKTASDNIRKASHDFASSSAPQFKGKSQKKRHQMAVAAGLHAARGESVQKSGKALTEAAPAGKIAKGTKVLYQGKQVTVQALTESGMALIKQPRRKDPIYVRATDLQSTQLNENIFLGMSPIPPTYVEPRASMLRLDNLTPADIGLFFEDDDTGEKDDQEEDTDNGGNVRHDGHTGKTEVDALPTPSDTISPAYSDEKPPKEISTPLSIHKGAEESHLWDEPNWDGYTYPADAPVIPDAEFPGSEMGNARAPDQNDHHDAGDGQGDPDNMDDKEEGDTEETSESYDPTGRFMFMIENWWKAQDRGGQEEPDRNNERDQRDSRRANSWRDKQRPHRGDDMDECGMQEMGLPGHLPARMEDGEVSDRLGPGEDTEPGAHAHIAVTLPAMASIVCTAQHYDPETLKAMIEALAEVGAGKTLDLPDLEAVARHINGEEEQEVMNRDAGEPDHEGIPHASSDDDFGGDDDADHGDHDGGDHDVPPQFAKHDDGDGDDHDGGDGDKTKDGKTKLMGGYSESIKEHIGVEYYGMDDIVATTALTEDEEIRMLKARAGLKFWQK